MKLNELTAVLNRNVFVQVEIMRNPADLEGWIVWVRDEVGKSDLLTDGSDYVLVERDMNELISLLRSLGLKQVGVTL